MNAFAEVEPAPIVAVTGAASGIGAAIAAELSNRGWRVAGLDLRHSDWDVSYEVDVVDAEAVARTVADIERDLGPLDAVVSAAGHYAMTPVAEIEPADWRRMLRVHLGGAMHLARAAAPGMVARGNGSIVAITSELAIGGGSGDAHYAAAKGAVIGLVRSLAAELAPHGVRVNGVAPGPTDTPMLGADSPWRSPEYLATLPLGRLVAPEEVALVVGFLVEDGTFATGEIVSPNAGAVI
jgi:NAD(P)-dependent dehydrogenase (short-subunit alcohol dehydrogenase family)